MTTNTTKNYNELKEGEKVPLMYDECMKIMFGNNDRLEPLTLLLSCVLEVRYENLVGHIEVVPNTLPNKELGKKKTERDIVVRLESVEKQKIMIEVNLSKKWYETILNRNIFYMNEVFTSGLEESETYDKIWTTFLINLNTFYTDKEHKKIFDTYYFRNEEGYILTKKQKILNINIEKCYQLWYSKNEIELKSPYEKDLFYLCAAMVTKSVDEFEECINMVDTKHSIKEIIEEVSKAMNEKDDIKLRYYDFLDEQRRINDSIISEVKNDGIKEGIKEGILKNKREMILNMYDEKININTIAKCANLSLEEVLDIINNPNYYNDN